MLCDFMGEHRIQISITELGDDAKSITQLFLPGNEDGIGEKKMLFCFHLGHIQFLVPDELFQSVQKRKGRMP